MTTIASTSKIVGSWEIPEIKILLNPYEVPACHQDCDDHYRVEMELYFIFKKSLWPKELLGLDIKHEMTTVRTGQRWLIIIKSALGYSKW